MTSTTNSHFDLSHCRFVILMIVSLIKLKWLFQSLSVTHGTCEIKAPSIFEFPLLRAFRIFLGGTLKESVSKVNFNSLWSVESLF
jgi:hypothetical protein